MDDRRIENALREGPPDEPGYVPSVSRILSDGDVEQGRTDGPAAFEGRPERRRIRMGRDAVGRRGGSGRLGWALPLAAVVTVAVVGLAVRFNLGPGATPSPRSDDLLARITADGVVRIAVSDEAPQAPTTGGAFIGFDVDVAQALAAELGVRADLQLVAPGTIVLGEGSWELALPSRSLPDDLIGAIAGARYYDWPAWLVVEAESSVDSIDDLNGSAICVVAGSPGAAWLSGTNVRDTAFSVEAPFDAKAVPRPNDEACLTALAAGEADAAVTSTLLDIDFGGRRLRVIGGPPVIVQQRFVLIRDSAELGDPTSIQAAVEAAINDLRSTGDLAELSRRAFGGEDLTGDPE